MRQVEVAQGGTDMAVTEQALNGVDVDTGFEQVGGEAVAQGMDAGRSGEAGTITGSPVDALGSLVGHWAVAGAVGK